MTRRLATLALAALVACGGESTAPSSTFQGDYVLQTVNGQSLPYTWTFSATASYTLRGYRLSIVPPSSWLSAVSYTTTSGGQVIDRPNGGELGSFTFTPGSGFVSLLSQDQTTFLTGTLSPDGRTLTITEDGDVYLYKR